MIRYKNKKTGKYYTYLASCIIHDNDECWDVGVVFSPEENENKIEVMEHESFYDQFEVA